jgi:hypothetical protein
VQQRTAIGLQTQSRQAAQRAQLIDRQVGGAQQMKARGDGSGQRRHLGHMAIAQHGGLSLQRHLIRHHLGGHHHQVAGHAAP